MAGAGKTSSKAAMSVIGGLAASRGLAAGRAWLYRGEGEIAVPEYLIEPGDVLDELARFHEARRVTREQLEKLRDEAMARGGGEGVAVFDNHLAMFDDPVVTAAVEQLIREDRLNAAAAVRKSLAKFRAMFESMGDAYIRERVRDLDDVERRFLRVLQDRPEASAFSQISSPVIIVADDLTPSETISLPSRFVLGFATGSGSVSSHVSLLARALGIPAVVGLGDVTSRVEAGDHVLLDGTNGTLTVHPDAFTVDEFDRCVVKEREIARGFDGLRDAPCQMKGGGRIELRANVSPGLPLSGISEFGAEGIGLYRSEYLWMRGRGEPSEDEQFEVYAEAVRAVAPGDPIVIRVLDLGGDKLADGMPSDEANPFLGNRSIRYLLSHRETFRAQLRAILRASALGDVRVMYPLVTTLEELKAANAELAGEMARLRHRGVAFNPGIRRGMMVEVPAAALNAGAFAAEADFLSIGTNDLVQYTMAADRGNEAVSYLYQPTNPAVLKLVKMASDAASAAGIPVSVCGASASDPVLGVLWAGLGIGELSMSASYIPVIKKTLGLVSLEEARSIAEEALSDSSLSAAAIYARCRERILAAAPEFEDIQNFFLHSRE